MVREIMRDEAFLSQKAEPATLEDLPVAQDLLDTLTAHRRLCGHGGQYDRRPQAGHRL